MDLPVTIAEPTDLGDFQGVWTGPSDVTFRWAGLSDAYGNAA